MMLILGCGCALAADDTAGCRADSASLSGGKLVFIPDSIADDVEKLLEGKMKLVRDDSHPDITETVIVRGDTVPVVSRDRNLGRYDRGLYNWLFVGKGTWQFGLTASYGEYSSEDLKIMEIIPEVDFSVHTFSIRPYLEYFVKNNVSVGFRLAYTQMKGSLGSLRMDIMDDMNIDIHDVIYNNESYSAAIISRQYIGLSRNSRFGVFNEIELAFGSGFSDFTRNYAGVPKNTHTTYMDAKINFSPGVTVFMMKNVAFNVSLGVFGFYLHNEKQIIDGEKGGSRFSSGANFKFNIFNINFGLGVFI